MRLKELEIQGFKSFPDRTKITIGTGITGVVGPNGSGKSNISDSIRWVLGETSSKQLRGSGKMEDVIFGGTQTRGAMGYASVALTIVKKGQVKHPEYEVDGLTGATLTTNGAAAMVNEGLQSYIGFFQTVNK